MIDILVLIWARLHREKPLIVDVSDGEYYLRAEAMTLERWATGSWAGPATVDTVRMRQELHAEREARLAKMGRPERRQYLRSA